VAIALGVLAFLTHPDLTANILHHLGLASIAPARAPPAGDGHELAACQPAERSLIPSRCDMLRRT